MTKEFKTPEPQEGELLVEFGEFEGDTDLLYCHSPSQPSMKRDGKLLMIAFERTLLLDGKTLRKELEERGYDITSLRFSVMKKFKAHSTHNPTGQVT